MATSFFSKLMIWTILSLSVLLTFSPQVAAKDGSTDCRRDSQADCDPNVVENCHSASGDTPSCGKEGMNWKTVAGWTAVGAGVGVTAIVAAPLALGAVGFGAAGVVAGTAAAAWQATIGYVAGGSLFATLQSVGAAGLAVATKAAIVTATAAVGATVGAAASASNHTTEA